MARLILAALLIVYANQVLAQQSNNFVALLSTAETYIKKDGSSIQTIELVHRALNETGRSQLSIQKIYFNKADSEFKFIEAYSVNQGKATKVWPQNIRIEKVNSQALAFTDLMEVSIPFDQVTVNGEVHLKYALIQSPMIDNIYASIIGISNTSLAKTEYMKYISEIPLTSYKDNFKDYYALNLSEKDSKYIYELKPTPKAYNLEGVQIENAILYLSSAKSWKQIADIETTSFKNAWKAELPKKLKLLISQAANKTTPQQTLEFLAEQLNKLVAYSGDWSTKDGKMKPAEMYKTLLRGKGDCKDYSTIMVALLQQLGYDAYPFLTFRSRSYLGEAKLLEMSKIPNPSFFNHVIVQAKDKTGKTWWIDPTNPYVQADIISSDILGNFGVLLDGKSGDVQFLPKANSEPSLFTMEQSIKIEADNSITGTGVATMNASAYNVFGMIERSYGLEGLKKIFAIIIHPLSKTVKLDLQRNLEDKTGFKYSFHATDFVKAQQGKSKAITVFNDIGIMLQKIVPDHDIDLGELGTTKMITHLKNQKEIDVSRAECLIRSKWIDADRTVENKADEVVISDIIKTKIRFIPKEDAHGDFFDVMRSEIIECAKNSDILLQFDDSLKTADDKKNDVLKGPVLEAMNDNDAETLFNQHGPSFYSYKNLKLFRFYAKKVSLDANDNTALFRAGASIANLGYIKGEVYVPEYLEEGIKYFDRVIANSAENIDPKTAGLIVKYLLFANKEAAAMTLFTRLNQLAPQNIYTYWAGFRFAKKRQKLVDAEKWLLAAEPLAVTEDDKEGQHVHFYNLYLDQARYKEAVVHQEYLANKKQTDPWAWHNLAILYYYMKDYDKNIELEKKALAFSEFGMAKKVICDSYVEKANLIRKKDGLLKAPNAATQYEEFLLESVKYNTTNFQSQLLLAEFYMLQSQRNNDKTLISKGRTYLNQAIELDSKHPGLQTLTTMYKTAERSPSNN